MRQDLHVENDLDALIDRPRFRRYGRLAPQLGIPAGQQVRAECTECGTHLLAVPHEGLPGPVRHGGGGPSRNSVSSPASSSTSTPSRSAFSSLEPAESPATT